MASDTIKTADKAYELFKKELALIPEASAESEDPIEKSEAHTSAWGQRCVSGYETARKETAGNPEKEARLLDAMVKETSQLTFVLFRRGLLTEELEAEFRELPLFETTDAAVEVFVKQRDEEIQRIVAERNAVQKEQNGLDIFQAMLTQNMSKEEAQQKLEEYEAKQKAALGA